MQALCSYFDENVKQGFLAFALCMQKESRERTKEVVLKSKEWRQKICNADVYFRNYVKKQTRGWVVVAVRRC